MLQKEFFQVQPFNPSPYWEGTVLVNLSGAEKYEEDTIFQPGRYEILVQAGGGYNSTFGATFGKSGKILTTLNITQNFIVRAYCGSSGTAGDKGVNLYSGAFKVNPYLGDISSVSHIFGNCGAASKSTGSVTPIETTYGGPNCLGDGARNGRGAGSCMHIMPVGGVFGTNYFFAFHTTPSVDTSPGVPGSGSAYGGSASGSASVMWPSSGDTINGYAGGGTPYGNGGARVTQSGIGTTYGNNGAGIGHGYASPIATNSVGVVQGSAAWFDGNSWVESLDRTIDSGEQGRIYIKYLGRI